MASVTSGDHAASLLGIGAMQFVADLHVHSYYSRATSTLMNLENLYYWSQLKGVTVVGTGDSTHPAWLQELQEKLSPAEPGLFELKAEYRRSVDENVPESCRGLVRFLISAEVSSIYKKQDKVRKVHNLIFFPDLAAASRFNTSLSKVGNIASDGRPIVGLDSKELLRMALAATPDAFFVPAHIWTPHFSVLGANSGFDSLEDCFEELTIHVHAVETGLSSDPAMNRRFSSLDRMTLISNSDAHSPDRLAREATIFSTSLSYPAMIDSLCAPSSEGVLGTLEFFPEEGKYHLDGHRACHARLTPEETRQNQGLCPMCGRKVTVGVLHRVEELADRPDGTPPAKPFESLVGLAEILSEILETGVKSKKVLQEYRRLLSRFGNELFILRECPLPNLKASGLSLLPTAIAKVRNRRVTVLPGYDGEYGKVTVLTESDRAKANQQLSLF